MDRQSLTQKVAARGTLGRFTVVSGFSVTTNDNVDGGAPADLSARKGGAERPEGCRMGAPGTADSAGLARRAIAQDRHAGGDECHSLSAAHRLWRYLPREGFPPRSTVYNIFRKLHSAREHGRRSGLNCTWHCVTEWAARPALRPRFSTASRSVGEIGGKRGGKDHAVGYDAGKKVKGHKIHVLVDAEGLPMRVVVHSAAIQDLVGYAIAETIERHDRTRFEVLGYSYGPDDASGLRRRFERAFDLIVDLSPRRVSLAMLRSRKWAAQKHWRSLFFSENLEFCTWRLCLAHANC